MLILLTLFYLFFPALLLYLCNKYKILDQIGAVVLAYFFGLIIGNSGILPEGSKQIQELIAMITVPLSLPLLLFSLQLKNMKTLAGKTLLSMFLSVVSLFVIIYVGWIFWGDKIPENWKVAGMLVGVYTGGTPNLASIKTALNVSSETYILVHTYDTIISAFFILFFISIGQKVYSFVLPRFKHEDKPTIKIETGTIDIDDMNSYSGIFKKKIFLPVLAALGISVLILAIGGGLSELVDEKYSMLTAILAITTLGILASLIPKINKIEKTFQAGMYLILIFCLDVASMAKFENLDISSLYLFYYILFAILGTMLLHILFSAIFKVDTDTTIITSTSLICSPPFVPVVAGALKNKDIILPGLTVGIVGYAVGNYLGVLLAMFLQP